MPSLYESTVNTGEVASSNFTTLYNSSGLQVPSAGAGQITGNLNVGGNLTVQGNSLLVGDVTLQGNLCLPNYCFPYPDGNTDQVMTTDGNGNLTWVDVTAIPGADYNISATTATGGANLTLANTAGFTDSVKFASGTNMSIVRTDANTITISTVADNIPDGTAQGQVLYWNGSAWTASSNIASAAANDRFVLQYNNSGAGTNAAVFLRKNYGATAYTTNDGVGQAFQLDSDSQTLNQIAIINAVWKGSPSATEITLTTNTLDNTVGPFTPTATFSATQATLPGDLAVNGGDITTTDPTGNLFNTNAVIVNIGNAATTEVNLGNTSSGQVQIKSPTIVGSNATQAVFNTVATTVNAFGAATNITMGVDGAVAGAGTTTIRSATTVVKGDLQVNGDNTGLAADITTTKTSATVFNTNATTVNAFGAANTLNMGSAASLTTLGNNLSINGTELKINADGAGSPADGFVYFNGTNESLKWNQTDTRFEFSDQLYISQTDIPAILERRTLSTDVSPYELKSGIKLLNRVTDAANNDVVNTGPSVTFGRTSGATATTERVFAGMGSAWDGTTGSAQLQFTWTNDNFSEPTPGNFPGTYTLLALESNQSKFYNDSVYIDYTAPGSNHTATSITGGNTLVFGVAHGFSIGERVQYTSTTQNGLTQNSYYYVIAAGFTTTQCQLGLTSTGSAIALTNGTGLTLIFVNLINRVGINTNTPAYTLDVNGDANVTGDIYVSGVHVDLSTPVHQGQLLYVSNDVTPTITNSNLISWSDATYRPNFQGDTGLYGRTQTGAQVSNNTGAVNYTTGDGSGLLVGVASDSQSSAFIGTFTTAYDTTGDHEVRLSSSTNNFANDQATSIITSNTLVFPTAHNFSIGDKLSYASPTQNGLTYNTAYYVIASGFTTTQCQVSLTLGGSAVALTNGTGLSLWFFNNTKRLLSATSVSVDLLAPNITLNATNTGIAGVDAGLTIERGTSGNDATWKWIESNLRFQANASIYSLGNLIADGPNIQVNADSTAADSFLYMKGTTEYLKWDDSAAQFEFSDDLAVGGNLQVTGDYSQTGETMTINSDSTAADSFLYMKGTSEYLKWNNTDTQFELSDDLEVMGNVNATSFNIDGDRSRIDTGNSTTWLTGTDIALTTTEKNVQKAIFYITDGTNVHTLEALALRTGTGAGDAMLTTYGEMYSSTALATFTAEISGSALRIRGTNTTATTLTVSILSTTLL